MRYRVIIIRLLLFAAACVPVFFFNDFYEHFRAYLTGNVISSILIGQWDIVIISILLFLAFLIPLSYRRKVKWAEYGMVGAFFISLFVEMYGIPFTILFAQQWLYEANIHHPHNLIDFHLFGSHFGMDLPMVYAACLIAIGILFIITAWFTLYMGLKRGSIVINGIYTLSRHPQYLGFILIIIGWLIGWPTPLTMIFSPILIYKYIRISICEEKEVEFEGNYRCYRENVPFLI